MTRYAIAVLLLAGTVFGQAPRPPVDKLSQLRDVTITTPTNNQVLKYDSGSSKWINSTGGGGGATAFIELSDVPQSYSGQALRGVRVNAAANALEFFSTPTPTPTPTSTPTPTATASATSTATPTATPSATALSIFKTITATGQSDVVADSDADTLNITSSGNIVITTNATTDTITFTVPTPTPSATYTPTPTPTPSATATAAAPEDAHYVTTQAESGLSNEFSLGTLGNGILKQTVAASVSTISIATAGTDYLSTVTADTPLSGSGTSGSHLVIATATDSVAGAMSSADHTTLTSLSTATGTGVAPAFTGVGVQVTAFKSGVDFKTNAVTDIFTVPTSRTFVVTSAYIIPTTVTSGAAVAIVWKIIESGGSATMIGGNAATNVAPVTTKVWAQGASSPLNWATCAAGNKVQFSITTAWTTSTTVTGNVFVLGFYSQ